MKRNLVCREINFTSVTGSMIRSFYIIKNLEQLTGMKTKIFDVFGHIYSVQGIINRITYYFYAFLPSTFYFPFPNQTAVKMVKTVSQFSIGPHSFLVNYTEDPVAQREELGMPIPRDFVRQQRLVDKFFFGNDRTILIFTTEDFQKEYGSPDNSVVIHSGADPDLFKFTPLPSNLKVLFIGGITKNRGLEVLIEGVRIARKIEKRIQLVIYGYGPDTEYVDYIAKSVSKFGGQYMGKIAHNEVPAIIEDSFVCVSPAIKSTKYNDLGEPMKLFEYMAGGRPVIGSNIKQQERIIKSEKCGIIYNDKSPMELAEALLTVIQDPQKAQIYAKNGREAIEKRWSWKKNVQRAIPKLRCLGAIP